MLSKDKGEKDLHAMATSNVEEESISQVPASGYGDMASVNTADEAYFFTGSSTVLSLMNHRPKPVAPVQVLLPDGKVHLGLATHTVGLGENVDNSTEQEINSLPEDTVLVGIQRARALGKAKFFRVKSLFVFFAVIHVASLCVAIVGSQKPSAIIKSPHMTRSVPSVNMIEPAVSISIVISLIMAVVGCYVWCGAHVCVCVCVERRFRRFLLIVWCVVCGVNLVRCENAIKVPGKRRKTGERKIHGWTLFTTTPRARCVILPSFLPSFLPSLRMLII